MCALGKSRPRLATATCLTLASTSGTDTQSRVPRFASASSTYGVLRFALLPCSWLLSFTFTLPLYFVFDTLFALAPRSPLYFLEQTTGQWQTRKKEHISVKTEIMLTSPPTPTQLQNTTLLVSIHQAAVLSRREEGRGQLC